MGVIGLAIGVEWYVPARGWGFVCQKKGRESQVTPYRAEPVKALCNRC